MTKRAFLNRGKLAAIVTHLLALFFTLFTPIADLSAQATASSSVDCTASAAPAIVEPATRSDVYQNFPFKAGEESKYSLQYGAVHVGYGFLRVKAPIKEEIIVGGSPGDWQTKNLWHMQFQGEAYTGDWYKAIFQGHDVILALSRPWDFSISKFYIRQNEHAALGKPLHVEKWLNFSQYECMVNERTVDHNKKSEKKDNFAIHYGTIDVLGALHKLRTYHYQIGKPEQFEVYSSEKNWIIKAKSIARESVKVEAGTFIADKLQVETYIGKEMQAKGDTFVWIATDHPSRPMIMVEAEVKIGHIRLSLETYTPGK